MIDDEGVDQAVKRRVAAAPSSARRVVAGALLAGALLVPMLGEAQGTAAPDYKTCTKVATPADIEAAKGAFKAGHGYFERGNYTRAVELWNDAYNFDCSRPDLLTNIANAQEKAGDRRGAVATLEAYLVRAPDAEDASTLREKVQNLKAAIDAEKPATNTQSATATVTETPKSVEMERPFGVAPWLVAGGGLLIAVGGIIPLALGLEKVSSADEACPDRAQCTDQQAIDDGNTGRTMVLVGDILIPVGGVALVAGLVWQFAFNSPEPVEKKTGSLRVTPLVAPTFGGFGVDGSF